jgi:SAM-dependent methyltransferase
MNSDLDEKRPASQASGQGNKETAARRPSYQTFPGERGSSESEAKFRGLKISSFAGKSVLDIGCNEGFFCFKAAAGGAARVVGLDRDARFIAGARVRYASSDLPQDVIEFRTQSWDHLPDEKFDIIFFLSALHYAADQAKVIHSLVERLTPSGMLVLECGIVEGADRAFVKVRRSIDEVEFPTISKMAELLDAYAWKSVGSSVMQVGDPTPRLVFHIRKLQPVVILLLGRSYSGKSTLARMFRKTNLPGIMIDDHVRIMATRADVDSRLSDVVSRNYDGERLDQLYVKILQTGLFDMFIEDVIRSLNKIGALMSFVEGAMGTDADSQSRVVRKFEQGGYFVWLANSALELSHADRNAVLPVPFGTGGAQCP